LIAI
jgi:hypothetical protein